MIKAAPFPLIRDASAPRSAPWWIDMTAVAGLLFLGAQIRVPLPFTPAPFTLQTLVILAMPFLLGRRRAFMGVVVYVFLGLVAQWHNVAFFAVSSTATYGYLFGFLLAPLVMAPFPRSAKGMICAMLLASVLILLSGSLWLMLLLGCSFERAIALGMVPFLAGDLVKAALAYKLASFMRLHQEPGC